MSGNSIPDVSPGEYRSDRNRIACLMKRHIPHAAANDHGNSRNVDPGALFNRHRDIDRGPR